jgi:hypothetical protein
VRPLVACAALVLATAAPVPAATKACRGTLSGSVTGKFECTVAVYTRDGTVFFSLDGAKPIDGIPGYSPGTFVLPGKPEARAYTLDSLGVGRASVAAEGGTFYSATKTSSQRGEVTLTLKSVAPDRENPDAFVVHGSYRARLLPAGGGKSGEVIVKAEF